MMKTFSRLLIRLLGTRLYLKIPQRLRRRLGMAAGEDMSRLNRLLKRLKNVRPKEEGEA